MIKIQITSHFERSRKKYVKKNILRAEKILSTLNTFRHDPLHRGLNIEKLVNSNIYSLRLDRGDRIFFTWINKDTALLLDIGKHDKYKTVV